ncbi:probable disease resistance protein At5g66900 [Rosa rugosa]|uniref:probable disease resistance protein At5g66900 n=1 Tax=Rosa rugosa TaxID=74645 RepID=UPI002B418036|nr:probable disease resistance protein At5g66900 [Rosa rugosa]
MDLIGGAVLGTTFGRLYDGVEDLIAKNRLFRVFFQKIKSRLDDLNPLMAEMTQSNQQLSYTQSDELRGLEAVLKVGEELVLKCSNVRQWDLYRKYKYATKLLEWEENLERQLQLLQVQVQGIRDGKKTAEAVDNIGVSTGKMQASLATVEVSVGSVKEGVDQISCTLEEVNQLMKENFVIQDQSTESKAWCAVPELPEVIVGLEAPLKDLKTNLLGNDGFSMLVLTAPGGCGKTTLATNFCKDQEVKDKFGTNIFFVTVSKKYSFNSIVEQLHRHKGSQVPSLQNEVNVVQWLQKFWTDAENKPLLLVLDDVWFGSESLLNKFQCRMANIKILVTSRSEFRAFSRPHHLAMLSDDDAMQLFRHSASLGDKSSHIPADLSRKIVKRCKGFPLAITVVGRSLCAQPIETWQHRLNQWSKGSSIFDFETDLLLCLQSSLDALDKKRAIIKECFLDLGSFPEDRAIPVDALIDIWSELYEIDEDTACIANLYELNNRSLANLIDDRQSKLVGEGYYGDHYVTQHDVLRELAIYHSKLDSVEHRERLIIDICGSNLPKWWREQKYQVMKARLLSISTDGESSTSKWPSMHLPETEVLLLNLREREHAIAEFVEKMDKLKVLVITSEDFRYSASLHNFQVLSRLSNLKRIRLERISISSIFKNSIQVKSLRKLSLIKCYYGIGSAKFSHAFPNLEEIHIKYTSITFHSSRATETVLSGLCDLISLKKVTLTSVLLCAFLDGIGNLVNLQVLRLRSCLVLSELPNSIKNFHKLNFLGIFNCRKLGELPECIGEMSSLRKIDLRRCPLLNKLPRSVLDLKQLEEVICDEGTESLWKSLLPSFRDRNQDIRVTIGPPRLR